MTNSICLCSTLQQPGHISSALSSHPEAYASELLETIEDMFPQYCMHSYIFNIDIRVTEKYDIK